MEIHGRLSFILLAFSSGASPSAMAGISFKPLKTICFSDDGYPA